jgi:hypothetical protein
MAIGVASANSACSGITEGLVACYPFDGNANDASGNGNHGTVNGATLTEDRFGNAESAYNFDGVDDFIEILNSNKLNFGSAPFSIILWAKTNYKLGVSSLISKGAGFDGYHGAGWGISYANTPQSLYLLVGDGSSHIECNTGYRSFVKWTQIGMIKESNGDVFMVADGVKTLTGKTLLGDTTNNINITMGKNHLYSGYLQGSIDDVRIYNRTLSESEIKQLYNPNCGDACENETAGCKHATYSVKERTLTIPFIELPVIDGLNNQPTGEVEMWQGALRLKYNTVDRFRLLSKQFAPITDDSNSTCPATYSFDTGILSIPYIDVPTVVAVGKAKFDSESKIEVFKAIMKWAPQENMFVVQEIEKQP